MLNGTGRRRRLPNGERRSERAPNIMWAESELMLVERAAQLRGESVGAFVANAALAVAAGRVGVVHEGRAQTVSGEEMALLRDVGRVMLEVRRQLAGAANNLNQLAAARNSGADVTTDQAAAVLTYVRAQLRRHDDAAGRVTDLLQRLG